MDDVHSSEGSIMAESQSQAQSARSSLLIEQHQALKRRIEEDTVPTDTKTNDTFLSQIVGGLGLLTQGEADSRMEPKETEDSEAEDQDENRDDVDADPDYDPMAELPDVEEMYDARESTLSADFEDTAVQWLTDIRPQILNFHNAAMPDACPELIVTPYSYQYSALGRIEYNNNTGLKGTLIGDPPGLGKTLIALMAVVKAIRTARCPSVVVVPTSCIEQWKADINKYFKPNRIRVMVLRDPNTSPLEVLKHHVVVTSYHFVMNQARKRQAYIDRLDDVQTGKSKVRPLPRPKLSIFSELFSNHGVKFPYLVLDEVNAVKNPLSATFEAMETLRKQSEYCIMMSGSPIDNTWVDLFALTQFLHGHPFDSLVKFRSTFGTEDKEGSGSFRPPSGMHLARFLYLLNAFIVRRPESTVPLPPLSETVVQFDLTECEARASNDAFAIYQASMGRSTTGSKKGKAQRNRVKAQMHAAWGSLTAATQHACHPRMVEIMRFAKHVRDGTALVDDSADILYSAEDIQQLDAWRQSLSQNRNWRSSRIQAITDCLNKCRDLDPDSKFLVFDESVYFLDIVQIAFAAMYDPVDCLRYDGRLSEEVRAATIDKFDKAHGCACLLISRGAGGVGLNIPFADVVFLCGPWWKAEWERQAIKRAHRRGQIKPVKVFKFLANGCDVESYKVRTRDRKHKVNTQLVQSITREDGKSPNITRQVA